MATDSDYNRQRLRWMATTMVMALQSDLHLRALQRWRAKEKRENFFFYFIFFKKIIFFTPSTDLVACSFDHSCREPTEMEIEK